MVGFSSGGKRRSSKSRSVRRRIPIRSIRRQLGTLASLVSATTCGAAWRVNSGLSGSVVRLGGSYQHFWDCNYGDDGGGPTGAHYAGFGITDTRWGPNTYGSKSFGVRDAHDGDYSSPGQLASQAHIWGR